MVYQTNHNTSPKQDFKAKISIFCLIMVKFSTTNKYILGYLQFNLPSFPCSWTLCINKLVNGLAIIL